MGAKNGILMSIAAFFYVISLIMIIFPKGLLFFPEFLILGMLIVVLPAIIGGIYNRRNWAWSLLSFVFGVMLVNATYLYFKTSQLSWFVIMFIISVFGFIYSVLHMRSYEDMELSRMRYKVRKGDVGKGAVVEPIRQLKDAEVLKVYERELEEKKATFEPGKYVASKTGSVYHSPKCDWAKKIQKKNQVWFETDAQARKAGLKKHDCVKK